jgi:hypothetical protein
MKIDARALDLRELFQTLKEVLATKLGEDVFIEILIQKQSDVKKIQSFAALSGCQTSVEGKEGYFIVRITGSPCCV